MRKAFISVSDKTGISTLAQQLVSYDITLIASEGTAAYLTSEDIPVLPLSDLIDMHPMLDGRVKTLHPHLYAGILGNKNNPKHMNELTRYHIQSIDFVIVDLYPFDACIKDPQQAIENIDVGGISLIRAAAKHFNQCTVLCDVNQYDKLMAELTDNQGFTSLSFRKTQATEAFLKSSHYDALIAEWFLNNPISSQTFNKSVPLSYGENPHQSAAFYPQLGKPSSFKTLQGSALSYNNLLDLDAGIRLVNECELPTAAVIKHTNPCAAATANNTDDAIIGAMHVDEKSAFGGIVVCNGTLDRKAACYLKDYFIEVIAARTITHEACELFSQKSKCRVIEYDKYLIAQQTIRSALNGWLVQDVDTSDPTTLNLIASTKQRPNATLSDIHFAYNVVKHVKSNAIVIVKNGVTLSIASGYTSRVDAVSWALEKARVHDLHQAVLASDGFFPFVDSIELIAMTPIKTIIQPGGSIRDKTILEACEFFDISMIMTGIRSFKH